MAFYRKKPVIVEAEQWTDTSQLLPGMLRAPGETEAYIDTLEGRHIVSPGDYVITGVKGEKYPCKPDIFAMTYEPASAEEKV